MKRPETYRFCFRRTQAERISERATVKLWDAAITKKTQERYYIGLSKLLPLLINVRSALHMDEIVSEWVQECWETGESLHIVNDGLCGLHHYQPWSKSMIPTAWRLFRVWRKVEAPNRAPPLTAEIVHAMALYALAHNNLIFGSVLLLGFFALLRTGEFLDVTAEDLLIGKDAGIVSLKRTKSGLRNAAHETVSFEDPITLEFLRTLKENKVSQNMHKVPLWTKSAQAFRNEFAHHCHRFHIQDLGFRPYSLRRGGATHLFQVTGSMEVALLKGRWSSTKVAKIYLSDGLSYLPGLTFKDETRKLLKEYSPFNQL